MPPDPVSARSDRDRKRDYWSIEPMRTIVIRPCPDERCGETYVTPVPHPDDPTGTPNRCPTCLATVTMPPASSSAASDQKQNPMEDR